MKYNNSLTVSMKDISDIKNLNEEIVKEIFLYVLIIPINLKTNKLVISMQLVMLNLLNALKDH